MAWFSYAANLSARKSSWFQLKMFGNLFQGVPAHLRWITDILKLREMQIEGVQSSTISPANGDRVVSHKIFSMLTATSLPVKLNSAQLHR